VVLLVTYSKKLGGISNQAAKVNIWTWMTQGLRRPEETRFSHSVLFDVVTVTKIEKMG
jgi:hypothetical protein